MFLKKWHNYNADDWKSFGFVWQETQEIVDK